VLKKRLTFKADNKYYHKKTKQMFSKKDKATKTNERKARIECGRIRSKKYAHLNTLLKQLQCMPLDQQEEVLKHLDEFDKLYIEERLELLPSFGRKFSRLIETLIPRMMFKSGHRINLIASADGQHTTFVATRNTIVAISKGQIRKTNLESDIISLSVLKNGMLIAGTRFYLYVILQEGLRIVSHIPIEYVYLVSISSDETQIVAISHTTITTLQIEDDALHVINTDELPHPDVTSCLWSPEGTHLIMGCRDGVILTCTVSMEDIVMAPPFHTDMITLKWLSSDTIISGGHDSLLGVWNFHNGQLFRQVGFRTMCPISKLCVHEGFIVGSWFRKLTVFSYCSGTLREVDCFNCNITPYDLIIGCSIHGNHLTVASWYGSVMRYKLKAKEQISMEGCMSLFPVK
jgi:WD40 repeat protein